MAATMYADSTELEGAKNDIIDAYEAFEAQVNNLKQTINGTNLEGSLRGPLIQKLDEKENLFSSVKAEIDNAQEYVGQQNVNLGNYVADSQARLQ